jgi:hypothetical protein
MVTVKRIEWDGYGPPDGEAYVTVTDGKFELLCFCCPCDLRVEGEELKEEIHTFSQKNTIKSDIADYSIQKLPDYFAYYLTAKVIDKAKHIVAIGDIPIYTYHIPDEVQEGDFVSFQCGRLDI